MSSTSNVNDTAINRVQSGIIASEQAKPDTVISQNADEVRLEAADTASAISTVAKDAADTAHVEPFVNNQIGDLATNFHAQASATTDHAIIEGQKDIEQAKATGVSYIEQAKVFAGNALTTAQSYVEAGQVKIAPSDNQGGLINTLQSTANSALETTKSYLSSAQNSLQPHVENAKAAAQPHIDAASQSAAPYVQSAKDIVQPRLEAVTSVAKPYVDAASAKIGELRGDKKDRDSGTATVV